MGEKTHIQDQVILFVNFKTMSIKVNVLIKPIPVVLAFYLS